MASYKHKRSKFFPDVRIQVFVQFILIFFLIISVTLFSSRCFYVSMIESAKMFATALEKLANNE